MIEISTLYWTFVALFGGAATGFFGWSAQHPPRRRKYGQAIGIACFAMALANVLMANEVLTTTSDGVTHYYGRFLGYFVAFGALNWLMGAIAGATRNQIVALTLVVYTVPSFVLAGWTLPEPGSSIASVLVFVGTGVGIAVLVGPIDQMAATVKEERRLLFGKMRNLVVTIMAILPIIGVMSAQNLSILTPFTGIFLATYLELILLIGSGVILLRSPIALDQVAADSDGPPETEPAERSPTAASD